DGRVRDVSGKGIMGAKVNIRQADGNGDYHPRYSGTFTTGKDGIYAFATVLPGQYGGVKHIHVHVSHEDYPSLTTQILFKGDPNLDEESSRKFGIILEKAQVKGEKILIGRFDIVLKTSAQ
ncbi:MAG: hypothetical protein HQM13_06165, partial [SAR324 cluster bacterium]|nr:hypothetical protein [SAR324 cluster bacterium]